MNILKKAINAYRKKTLRRTIIWHIFKTFQPHKAMIVNLKSGAKIRIYTHDVIGQAIYAKGAFEPDLFDFLSNFLKSGMVILDLGANIGQYTILAAQRVGPNGSVHSFEPCTRMFEELKFNIMLNNLEKLCTLNKIAISDKQGTAFLSTYKPGAEVYSSIGNHKRKEAKALGHEEVKTETIDNYRKVNNIKNVDFMKIDVEGAELLVLHGAKQLLSRPNSPVISLEFADINTQGFGYKALEIWDFLTGLGYKMYSLDMKITQKPNDFIEPCNLIAKK